MPHPEKTKDGWRAHITMVDVFGNCTTDLPAAAIASAKGVTFRLCGRSPRLPSGWSGGI
jgi:S-adenosylmethionine hydrolase